jgi:hypothetical protein
MTFRLVLPEVLAVSTRYAGLPPAQSAREQTET